VKYYKLAQPNGWDFHTGNTINYRENIGKTVKCPNGGIPKLCSDTVIHASKNPNDCFIGASTPCSAYLVEGIPACEDDKKSGFKELAVIEEITDLDSLFGWKYSESLNPINPLLVKKHKVTKKDIENLKKWDSVWDSVGASVRDSVWASVGASVRDSVWDSVWASVGASVWDSVGASVRDSVRASVWDSVGASVRDSVGASVWDSVGASVWDSVRASVWAYIGSLFPNIKKWRYIDHIGGKYPYQCCVALWKRGFMPVRYLKQWHLLAGNPPLNVFTLDK